MVDDKRWDEFNHKHRQMEEILENWRKTVFSASDQDVQELLIAIESSPLRRGVRAEDLIKRPEFSIEHIIKLLPEMSAYSLSILEEAAIQLKYKGYIDKQQEEVENFMRLEEKNLPADLDYDQIRRLSNEAKQRLKEVHPTSVGQASRISGVNPADISVILIYLEQRKRSIEYERF